MGIFIYAKVFLDNFSLKSQQKKRYQNKISRENKCHKSMKRKMLEFFSSCRLYFVNDIPHICGIIFVFYPFFNECILCASATESCALVIILLWSGIVR